MLLIIENYCFFAASKYFNNWHIYILSETRMLRNHYFSFFLSTKVCYHLQDLPKLLLIVGVVCQSVFNPFIEFSHLGVNNSWLIYTLFICWHDSSVEVTVTVCHCQHDFLLFICGSLTETLFQLDICLLFAKRAKNVLKNRLRRGDFQW